ncbi:MAG TPA: glycosyltransferase family 2 protein [Candidatus Binataceae bacterium]|nr:glycosyltransferase family 2 protein [Candidatus Binataceae bacterium]
MFDLCICTHNPRVAILRRCLEAIETQLSPPAFRLLLVDNASQPPLTDDLLDHLRQRGVPTVLIRERRLGLTAARLAAFEHSNEEWLVFIDDDNVIDPDFLRLGAEFARTHPEVGAFGGRILLPPDMKPPGWMIPLLGSMGVKDEGDKILINSSLEWDRHDPPGAGLWVRSALVRRFADRTRSNSSIFSLGRRGNNLASCEDAVLVKGARELGFCNAYVPALRALHYLKPERFTFRHAMRSLFAYGRSIALYERIMALGGEQLGNLGNPRPLIAGWRTFNRERKRSIRYAATQAVYQWSYERNRQALAREQPDLAPDEAALNNLVPFLRTGASAHLERMAIVVEEGSAEFAVYGPYWTLPAGRYEMRAEIISNQQLSGEAPLIIAQVTAKCGTLVLAEGKWPLNKRGLSDLKTTTEFRLPFSLARDLPLPARTIETRIFTPGNVSFRIISLCLRRASAP